MCDVAYCLSSILCKISVGIFLLRVTVDKIQRIVIYAVTTLAAVFGLMFLILLLAQCKPVEFFWMRLSTENPVSGSCINMTVVIVALYIFSAVSFIFDLTVGVLPVFVVRNLQMRRDVKFAVAGLLGMACMYVKTISPTVHQYNLLTRIFQCLSRSSCPDGIRRDTPEPRLSM